MLPYLPDDVSSTNVVARLGLISDTHMPARWPSLPPGLLPVLSGVDLLLHAGDVGELWVLDQLSVIAPVIAVHGNDETAEAQAQLPFQQLLTVAGQRILLWHSHHPDRETELAMRRIDTWTRILDRSAKQAQAAGAQIVVMGHLHVPFCTFHEGVWIINPGALASGNYQTRQAVQTVAVLFLLVDGTPRVTHINLAPPEAVYRPELDWAAPFSRALQQFSASILGPGLDETVLEIGRRIYRQWPEEFEALFGPLAHRVWRGDQDLLTAEDLLCALEEATWLPAGEQALLSDMIRDAARETNGFRPEQD